MPATDCSAARTLSCVAFRTIISYLFLVSFDSLIRAMPRLAGAGD
jgi:hypothetical protein